MAFFPLPDRTIFGEPTDNQQGSFIAQLKALWDFLTSLLGSDGNPATARTNLGLEIGKDVQAYDALTAKTNIAQSFTKPQRGSVTTANTLAIDLSLGNFFKATLGAAATLSFSNIAEGQTGEIFLDNSGGYTISKGANILCDATLFASISSAGKYRLSYICYGTSVLVTASKALS